ncbi:MAG: DUF1549 and DUF1553 domain-containing protein [Planctomycetota bacterium]
MFSQMGRLLVVFVACVFAFASALQATEPTNSTALAPIYERFASTPEETPSFEEVPDFQKHVSPLFGRLGCNGRACHGSFQGAGGFQLSLFGYDFLEDYKALLEEDTLRVDLEEKHESLILVKPVDAELHEGGKRYTEGEWEYWVLRSWIEAGAPFSKNKIHKLQKLEVTPKEIRFSEARQSAQLKALAHWEDGTIEDVTCLCRFKSNDAAVAKIDETGLVTSGEAGDTHVVVSYDNAVVPIAALQPVSEKFGKNYPSVVTNTRVDELVVQKLRKLGIIPSELCSDEEFLRRSSLDVTGTLPSPSEVEAFVKDRAPDKRERKINELLSRPGYAAQWTTFLCDITGNNEDQLRNFLPAQINPSSHWYQWIYKRVQDNVPYDQIVEGIVTATSRAPEESYLDYCEEMSEICRDRSGKEFADRPGMVYYWSRNNFRTPEDRAIGFAYSFLGVRIQCAQCHKHPFDQWSKDDFYNFEQLFTAVQARQNTMAPDAKKQYTKMVAELGVDKKLRGNQLRREFGNMLKEGKTVPMPELVVAKPRARRVNGKIVKGTSKAKLLGSNWVEMGEEDIRGELMGWLRNDENPYFTKAIVNRVWAQYFGVGIVNPPDDLNLANAPSNAALLDYLADGFRDNNFNLKWLHQTILNSDTYQRSWVPNESNAKDKQNFSHAQLRRLPAEATYDAVRMALASNKLADGARLLELPRAISKPGASARNNRQDDESYALRVFGRSIRESNCDCDRSSEPSLLQTIFMANDSAVHKWLNDPKTSWVAEVNAKFGWKSSVSPQEKARMKNLTAQLERMVKGIKTMDERIATLAKQDGKNQKQIAKSIAKKREEAIKRAKSYAKKNDLQELWTQMRSGTHDSNENHMEPEPTNMSEEQATWIAQQAYLRSLSREPNSQELDKVVAFLREDENPSKAVEGLMWSLVNTKEFILNH